MPDHDPVLDMLRTALDGQYAVERELGRGGMGIVYLARDVQLDRAVAIKVLPPALASDEESLARFVREARMAAQLSHPHIVPVHRADRALGCAFFVMGHVDGETLAARLRDRGALPAEDVVRLLREVAWALAYAHARGLVHRDVKPENVMIERASGRAMVTDFGIARHLEADALTRTGHVLGTAYYMSPEQVGGEAIDGRSDLYSLGVVGFQALSGRLPFEGTALGAILVAHATRPAPPLASVAPQVPAALAAVIDRCLAKDPAARYATGEALADALERALEASRPASAVTDDEALRLSEAQAAALWGRAAQLQADALRRLDAASAPAALRATGGEPTGRVGVAADGTPTPSSGYALRHVREAAAGAGISEQYMALALAELRRDPAGVRVMQPTGSWQERDATRLLGTAERSRAVSVTLGAPPALALRVLGRVLQAAPFELGLREVVGGHPLDGGVMVFDLPGRIVTVSTVPSELAGPWLSTRHSLEAEQVQVTLRALPGGETTEATMFVDLRPGVRRNVNASVAIASVVGSLGGITGAAAGTIAAKMAGLAFIAGAGPAAGLGAAAVAGGSVLWYRWLYRRTVAKAEAEMRRALGAVDAQLRSARLFGDTDVFGLPARLPAPRTPPPGGP